MKEVANYKILPMLCNERGVITVKNLTGLMLDLAFRQSEKIEKNFPIMDKKVWLIYSWDIEFISPIYGEDEIEITTFPTNMKRFYAYRNFEIRRDGDLVAKAEVCLILYDLEKQRASIIDKEIAKAFGTNEKTYSGKAYKMGDDFDRERKIQIRRADFDKNLHVNNGIYFDFLREIEAFDEVELSYIKLVYKNEIRKEDDVLIFYKKDEKQIDFKIESHINHAFGVISYV